VTRGVLIDWEGELWRFTGRQWERFCRVGAEGGELYPKDHGARYVGLLAHSPLDWTPTDYRHELDSIAAAKRPRNR
jgi:hypothetical protein